MSEAGKNLEGQVVDGKFPLLRYLGESDHSVVFLTERKMEPRKVAIKLIPARVSDPEIQISFWEAAARLSHPHLIRLFEMGRCQIRNETNSYLVMEYAEENLYQILPDRALNSEEAREMIPPVLDALGYLHTQGFVHGHIKPSNIMATGDLVRISSDGIIRIGQPAGFPSGPSLYDAPEAAKTGISPAGDVWSLGVTLVEALTQHPPSPQGAAEGQDLLPQSLAIPFSEIVRNCLRPRPEQRWSLEQIAAKLNPQASPKPVLAANPRPEKDKPASARTPEQPTFAKPKVFLGSAALVLALLVWFFIRLLHHAPAQDFRSAGSSPTAVPQQAVTNQSAEAQVVPESPPQSNATRPSETNPEPTSSDARGAPVHQALPEVPSSASRTIRGTIRVKVSVTVDASGAVSSASLVSPGSSAYFARLALQTARKWTFAPATSGRAVPKAWILTFEFRQSGPRASSAPAH